MHSSSPHHRALLPVDLTDYRRVPVWGTLPFSPDRIGEGLVRVNSRCCPAYGARKYGGGTRYGYAKPTLAFKRRFVVRGRSRVSERES